jgi:hypothetical protein
MGRTTELKTESRPHNSTYKKLAVQWLNEVQFFNQTFVQADSFVLRNRHCAKRQPLVATAHTQPLLNEL